MVSTGLDVRLSIALKYTISDLQLTYKNFSKKIKTTNSLHLSSKSSTVMVRSIRSSSTHSCSRWMAVSRRTQQNRQTLMVVLNLALVYQNGPWLLMNLIVSLRRTWLISFLSNGCSFSSSFPTNSSYKRAQSSEPNISCRRTWGLVRQLR